MFLEWFRTENGTMFWSQKYPSKDNEFFALF